ncbi:acyl carrier protein [Paenibacillus motobuensis]
MQLKDLVAGILNIEHQDIHEGLSPQVYPGWTSMKHIQLIAAIEETYKVKFTVREMKGLKNYAAFISALKSRGIGDEVLA